MIDAFTITKRGPEFVCRPSDRDRARKAGLKTRQIDRLAAPAEVTISSSPSVEYRAPVALEIKKFHGNRHPTSQSDYESHTIHIEISFSISLCHYLTSDRRRAVIVKSQVG